VRDKNLLDFEDMLTDREIIVIDLCLIRGKKLIIVHIDCELVDFDEALKSLIEKLKEAVEVITTLPCPDQAEESKIAFDVLVGSDISLEDLKQRIINPSVSFGYCLGEPGSDPEGKTGTG
jgi:hypothetical protein